MNRDREKAVNDMNSGFGGSNYSYRNSNQFNNPLNFTNTNAPQVETFMQL